MAIYPGATWRPVSGLAADPPIIPRGVILHVDGGNSHSLFGYFNGASGGIEAHFHIRADGHVEQYRDTEREADANYLGNSWIENGQRYGFISVETQGLGAGEWTPEQLNAIDTLIRWVSGQHQTPMTKATGYHGVGVGYHVMWGTGRGKLCWSNAAGKICPGPRRIAQYHDLVLPRLARPVGPATPNIPPITEVDDMTPEQAKQLKDVHTFIGAVRDGHKQGGLPVGLIVALNAAAIRSERASGSGDTARLAAALIPALSTELTPAADVEELADALAERLDSRDVALLASRLAITVNSL